MVCGRGASCDWPQALQGCVCILSMARFRKAHQAKLDVKIVVRYIFEGVVCIFDFL